MCDEPKSPNTGDGDRAETDEDTERCTKCDYWMQNHEAAVDCKDSKYATSTQYTTPATVKYDFAANLADGEIVVKLICEWGSLDAGATAAIKTKVKKAITETAPNFWSGQKSLKITDPVCGEKTVPIKFKIVWKTGTETAHYKVMLKKGVWAAVSFPDIKLDYDVDLADDAWVVKHEIGHAYGLHDEYFYSGKTSATVTYKRADGTTEAITLPKTDNVMSTTGKLKVESRFLYFAEIEAQELLRAKSGRDVTCEVV